MDEFERKKLEKKAEMDRRINIFFDKMQEANKKNKKK